MSKQNSNRKSKKSESMDRVELVIQRKRKAALKSMREGSSTERSSRFNFNQYIDNLEEDENDDIMD